MVDHTPWNPPKSTTVLYSICLNGDMAFSIFPVGMTVGKFLAYLKEVLIPNLRPDDVVVMNNLRTHHVQVLSGLLHRAGANVLYLPLYGPYLNPIKKLWAKVKSILRKLRIRPFDALDAAIRFTLGHASPDDCAGRFRLAGYCLF